MFGKGGVCYFSHPDGGGHAILSSRNGGGQHFFSYSEALSATPPPPLKFMNSPLVETDHLLTAGSFLLGTVARAKAEQDTVTVTGEGGGLRLTYTIVTEDGTF